RSVRGAEAGKTADYPIARAGGASDQLQRRPRRRILGEEDRVFEVAYETTFCATHVLTRGGQPIDPPHGSDWRVAPAAAGDVLSDLGVVGEFERVRKAVGEVPRRSHKGDITSPADFGGQSPCAEAVARYFFREVRKGLGAEGRQLKRVRVWEAPGCSA